MSDPKIGLLMMVKNETKTFHKSLNSVIGHIDLLIIFDTGSTDNTIQIVKEFSKKHNIPLHLKQGEFVNFSVSRNISLDFAEKTDADFLLLLDSNDELQGGDKLRKFAKKYINSPTTGFLTCQHWWSGQYDKYFNIRFVRNKRGWRYVGSVHEWMKNTGVPKGEKEPPVVRMPDDIVIYQDRTNDDDKSSKRFTRDKILLLKDYQENPQDPRTVFYLAQTCSCLDDKEEAFYYYKIRSTMEGFQEEKFHSFLRCGNFSQDLNHSWYDSLSWYMKAFEHSERVEPLIKISEYYVSRKKWVLAYTFIDLACKLDYPYKSILFVDERAYSYKRWHLMGIIGYYAGRFKSGKIGCLRAIEKGVNKKLDENNLRYYLDKEKELGVISEDCNSKISEKKITKKEFIEKTKKELKQENPKITEKKLRIISLKKWKSRTK